MSVHLHDSLTAGDLEHRLRACLCLYINETQTSALVQAHDLRINERGVPEVLAGYPLTRDGVQQLVSLLRGTLPVRALWPASVLSADPERVAWWTPARRRRIWFCPKQQPRLQHLTRREVLHPATLFVADPGRLYVFALAENTRPLPDTPVYQPPYLNCYEDGQVCTGEVVWPGSVAVETLPQWEATWFDSVGTFPVTEELTRFPGGHNALWEAMQTAETFPADALLPLGQTVLDVVNRVAPYRPPGPAMRERILTPAAEVTA